MSENTARGFLDFILAHLDDDAPRLVFADWLEEQGDSDRAEFIRVQIERASLPEWDARQVRLRLRERELIELHGLKWKWELPNIDGITWGGFRRGFVATATFASFTIRREKASACWTATPSKQFRLFGSTDENSLTTSLRLTDYASCPSTAGFTIRKRSINSPRRRYYPHSGF